MWRRSKPIRVGDIVATTRTNLVGEYLGVDLARYAVLETATGMVCHTMTDEMRHATERERRSFASARNIHRTLVALAHPERDYPADLDPRVERLLTSPCVVGYE